MSWFTLALIPPFFWALSNIVDKYILSDKNINLWEGLIIINITKTPFIILFGGWALWQGTVFTGAGILWGCLLGIFCTLAVFLYIIVLQKEEASIALPLYEIGPIWSLLLGFFILSETPPAYGLLGIGVISIGGLVLSREHGSKAWAKKGILKLFLLVLLSSFFYNIIYVIFKHAHLTISLEQLFFFQYTFQVIFSTLAGIVFNKIQLGKGFPSGSPKVWISSIIGESISMIGTILAMLAYTVGSVGLVRAIGSTQTVWVLLMSLFLSRFYPQHFSEKWDTYNKYKKFIGVSIILMGVFIIGKGEF